MSPELYAFCLLLIGAAIGASATYLLLTGNLRDWSRASREQEITDRLRQPLPTGKPVPRVYGTGRVDDMARGGCGGNK